MALLLLLFPEKSILQCTVSLEVWRPLEINGLLAKLRWPVIQKLYPLSDFEEGQTFRIMALLTLSAVIIWSYREKESGKEAVIARKVELEIQVVNNRSKEISLTFRLITKMKCFYTKQEEKAVHLCKRHCVCGQGWPHQRHSFISSKLIDFHPPQKVAIRIFKRAWQWWLLRLMSEWELT